MYYVYLLQDIDKKLYIGYSSNLRQRLKEHLKQKVYTTKKMNNLQLIYYEAYQDELQAKTREKKLKQFGSAYHGLLKRLRLK